MKPEKDAIKLSPNVGTLNSDKAEKKKTSLFVCNVFLCRPRELSQLPRAKKKVKPAAHTKTI